jgi:23S rRNA (guanosine2251-2'-O)-methyltransferase
LRSRDAPAAEAWIGGRRAVLEAVRAGTARAALVAAGSRLTPGLRELLDEAARAAVPVRRVDGAELDRVAGIDHQGVAAAVVPPPELDDRALAAFPLGPNSLVVVLDGIEDPQNLGASARSAEAAGAAVLVARQRRSAPRSSAAVRASAGALLHLPVARVVNLRRTLERLKERGFFVVGLDQRADRTIHDAGPPPRPLAVVLGSEAAGISKLVRDTCDLLVAIPMAGRTASLNASAALAAGLFGYALRPNTSMPAR